MHRHRTSGVLLVLRVGLSLRYLLIASQLMTCSKVIEHRVLSVREPSQGASDMHPSGRVSPATASGGKLLGLGRRAVLLPRLTFL